MGLNPSTYLELCEEAYARRAAGTLDIFVDPVQIIIEKTEDGTCLAIAGTDDGCCVRTDLDFFPVTAAEFGCLVHGGMWHSVRAAWPQIYSRVQDISGRIILTGHSLGGGEALQIAGLLSVMGRPPGAVITFGAPKISIGATLGEKFRRNTDIEITQFRNGLDLIPDLPPSCRTMDWQHPSKLTQIGENHSPIEDHFLNSYRSAIPNHAAEPGVSA